MKKGLFISCLLLLSFGILSCSFDKKEEEKEEDSSLKNNSIYVDSELNSNKSYQIKLSLDDDSLIKKYSGKHCTVYYSNKLNSSWANSSHLDEKLTDSYFKQLGEKFDSIYELETYILGSNKAPYENKYKARNLSNRSANSDDLIFDNNGKGYNDDLYIFRYNTSSNDIFEDSVGEIKKINDITLSTILTERDFIYNDNDALSYLNIDYSTVDSFQNKQSDIINNYLFENGMYSRAAKEQLFPETNSKVILVVMDIGHDSSESQNSGVLGYFSQYDMLSESYLKEITGKKDFHGNERQILYLDSYFLLKNEGMVHSTIVHEFNHLLNYIHKNIKLNKQQTIPTWYTEMLSMVSEDMFSDYLGLKFSATPRTRFPTFSEGYNLGFTEWRDGNDVYNSYANAFAYGSFLVRNYGGINLLNILATNEDVGEIAINEALSKLGYKDRFKDTVYKFYRAIVNNEKTGNTLNKATEYYGKLGFSAISLKDIKYKYINDDDTYDCYPVFYDKEKVGPKGCIIQYIDRNWVDENLYITYSKPKHNNIEVKVIPYGEL